MSVGHVSTVRGPFVGHLWGVLLAAAVVMLAVVVPTTPVSGQVAGTASFVIDKVLEGDAALRGPVTIAVSCSNGREETISFARGVSPTEQVVGGLAPGTTCTVTEPVDGSNRGGGGDDDGRAGRGGR